MGRWYSGDGTSIEFWDLWGNNQSQKPWDWDFSHECLCHTRMFPTDFYQVASGLHFSAFWRPDNQKVWMLMITSRKILNKWIPAPGAQKGEILGFYFIHVAIIQNSIKRQTFET